MADAPAGGSREARHPGHGFARGVRVLWAAARRRDVAVVYAAIVTVVTVGLGIMPRAVADDLVLSSSTNLVNLRQHPPLVLIASAFVEPSIAGLVLVLPLVWVLGMVQLWLGRAAVLTVVALGHVGVTVFVATLLAAGINQGRVALVEATATDVGVSYGLVAALGLLAARVSKSRRPWYVLAMTGGFVLVLLVNRSFTDLGHVVAWLLGLALSLLVVRGAATTERHDRCQQGAGPGKSPSSVR